jgi:hypothetical protein
MCPQCSLDGPSMFLEFFLDQCWMPIPITLLIQIKPFFREKYGPKKMLLKRESACTNGNDQHVSGRRYTRETKDNFHTMRLYFTPISHIFLTFSHICCFTYLLFDLYYCSVSLLQEKNKGCFTPRGSISHLFHTISRLYCFVQFVALFGRWGRQQR